jgi:probable addiction module antidote protein
VTTEYALFDASSYLDSDEMIAEYLTAAAEDENPDVLLLALANVAKARGMTQVAEAAGLGRESLYKTLAPGAHPRMSTVRAILRALNVRLTIKASPATKLAKAHRKTGQPKSSAKADEKEMAARIAAAKKEKAALKKARAEAAKPATPAKKRA